VNKRILTVEKLSKQFFLHEQKAFIPSCKDVNLTVYYKEMTALVGPTGCGKSSVLKCIYRTYLPSSGRILYHGDDGITTDLAQAPDHRILELRKRDIGFVTQFFHCMPRKNTLDVVGEPLVVRGEKKEVARNAAADILRLLNVPERLWDLPPATFSGGEKQRVNLARGLILKPRLLLLDEPTASLDPATTERVIDLLSAIKAKGVAMLAVFHHPELVSRLSDRVVELTPQVAEFQDIEEKVQ
jgi:alpha-D-ribose 1-methylphosphonate 5-triphosphate synthase subunit PhnL